MENSLTKKWYNNVWLDLVLYVLIVPVGLYGVWKSQYMKKGWKIFLSVFSPIFLILNIGFVAFIFSLFKSPAEQYYTKAKALQDSEDYPAAAYVYMQAVEADPKYSRTYFPLAQCLREIKDYKRALPSYTMAIESDEEEGKSNIDAYYYRGLIVLILAQSDTTKSITACEYAISDFNKVIALDAKYSDAYYQRASAKVMIGLKKKSTKMHESAILDFNNAIENDPKNKLLYMHRANTKMYAGDKTGAISDYSKAIEIDPNFVQAYYLRGFITLPKEGQPTCGCVDINKAVKLGYNDHVALFYFDYCKRYAIADCEQ